MRGMSRNEDNPSSCTKALGQESRGDWPHPVSPQPQVPDGHVALAWLLLSPVTLLL